MPAITLSSTINQVREVLSEVISFEQQRKNYQACLAELTHLKKELQAKPDQQQNLRDLNIVEKDLWSQQRESTVALSSKIIMMWAELYGSHQQLGLTSAQILPFLAQLTDALQATIADKQFVDTPKLQQFVSRTRQLFHQDPLLDPVTAKGFLSGLSQLETLLGLNPSPQETAIQKKSTQAWMRSGFLGNTLSKAHEKTAEIAATPRRQSSFSLK